MDDAIKSFSHRTHIRLSSGLLHDNKLIAIASMSRSRKVLRASVQYLSDPSKVIELMKKSITLLRAIHPSGDDRRDSGAGAGGYT